MYWSLIHKFLSDQCTEAEREEVKQWLGKDPDHQQFLQSIQKIWEVEPKSEKEVDVKKAWDLFRSERMRSEERYSVKSIRGSANPQNEKSRSRLIWYQKTPVYAAAAAVLLLITVFVVVRTQLEQSAKITYQQVVTGKGEKTSLKLSDGTRVKLNAESRLKIPSNYGKTDRHLYLKGEAFFKVKHAASKPFTVYTRGIYTKDVGTRFNIRAFREDSTITVVVAEGKVALGKVKKAISAGVLLSSNERAEISNGGNPDIRQVADLSSYIGWTQGKLVFNDTPFNKMVQQLERWYGVECLVKNKMLLRKKLTATFENEPLSNVLQLITKSMDVTARIEGQTVVFSVRQEKGR